MALGALLNRHGLNPSAGQPRGDMFTVAIVDCNCWLLQYLVRSIGIVPQVAP